MYAPAAHPHTARAPSDFSRRASALAGQVLSTSWSTWDIFRTLQFKMRFEALVADALCGGANLLPNYWHLRNQFNVRRLGFPGPTWCGR